jgi:hypothetical protein
MPSTRVMVSGDVCSGIHKDTARTSPENLVGKCHTEVGHLDGSKKTGGGKLQPKKAGLRASRQGAMMSPDYSATDLLLLSTMCSRIDQ